MLMNEEICTFLSDTLKFSIVFFSDLLRRWRGHPPAHRPDGPTVQGQQDFCGQTDQDLEEKSQAAL